MALPPRMDSRSSKVSGSKGRGFLGAMVVVMLPRLACDGLYDHTDGPLFLPGHTPARLLAGINDLQSSVLHGQQVHGISRGEGIAVEIQRYLDRILQNTSEKRAFSDCGVICQQLNRAAVFPLIQRGIQITVFGLAASQDTGFADVADVVAISVDKSAESRVFVTKVTVAPVVMVVINPGAVARHLECQIEGMHNVLVHCQGIVCPASACGKSME